VGVALLLVSGVASAFVAEAVLRAFPQKLDGFPFTEAVADSLCPGQYWRQAGCLTAAAQGLPFDRRSTLDVIQDLEARGIEAWPSFDASHFLDPANALNIDGRAVVPVAPGIPEVLTVFCNEAGTWVTYEADEYGFNNPLGSHREGEIEVAVVGDSFVQGWCVPFEQTLVGRMRELHGGVLGVGVEGSGPLVQLGVEVEYLAPLRPRVVVWVFYEGNDLRDFVEEAANEVVAQYLEPNFRQGLRDDEDELGQKLREHVLRLRVERAREAELDAARRETALKRYRSLAGWVRLSELRSRLRDLAKSNRAEQPYDEELVARVLVRMRDDVARWGGTLVFAYMPTRVRFSDASQANPHRARILARARDLGVPIVDLFEPLSRHPDPLSLYPFRVESHLNAEGYEIVARFLHESLDSLTATSPVVH
jgi:hypothetical protein